LSEGAHAHRQNPFQALEIETGLVAEGAVDEAGEVDRAQAAAAVGWQGLFAALSGDQPLKMTLFWSGWVVSYTASRPAWTMLLIRLVNLWVLRRTLSFTHSWYWHSCN